MECKWNSCGETFCDQKEFAMHVNSHVQDSNTKTCQWKDCTRMVEKKISRCTLLTHIRIHTREKPFKCNLCNKEYSRSDALSKHTKTHEQLAATESVYIKKMSYLLQLQQEREVELQDMQQQYKRLIVENDILLRYICDSLCRQ
ncbi:hypothetical protein NEHOM01_0555 [Nematocida homosporus]|uniref:uncharacterized protein n=1 Tax=Nematocida homosporus TaxID=1912981 RepID=UPI002220F01A|nr:uncharacterized protein NEHOM01_0555 [Nematocida homosporus]KAI5185004.1 hypothetical protein NEHOM01_0555 [Nematocida homosporus]